MRLARCLLALAIGYLCGSFPSGVLIGRWRRVDVRRYGSGRTGATNVLRTLGPRLAGLVALIDILKGALPVLLARRVFFPQEPWAEPAAGLGAVVGHTHSLFLKFGGGRGVLTTGGALLPRNPLVPWIALICAAIPIKLTRYISLGSMIGVTSQAIIEFALALRKHDSWPHFAYALASAVFVIAEHHDNIRRLLNGSERKVGEKVVIASESFQTLTASGSPSLPAQVR
jgi:glycerol-3-phosphate acyltransferase PlsY